MANKRPVEDSTRGRASIMPVNYKGDCLVQCWIDARKLAVLSEWLDKGGYTTRYLSDVLRFTVDEIAEQVVSSGIVKKIEFTTEAREILMIKYRANLNPGGRGNRNLLHNLHLDEIRKGNVYQGERSRMIVKENSYGGDFNIDEQLKVYHELEKRDAAKIARDTAQKQIDKVRAENGEGEKNTTPALENCVDVEENIRKAKLADDKAFNMPIFPKDV